MINRFVIKARSMILISFIRNSPPAVFLGKGPFGNLGIGMSALASAFEYKDCLLHCMNLL